MNKKQPFISETPSFHDDNLTALKKPVAITCVTIVSTIAIIGLLYVAGIFYFQDKFFPNSYIGNVDVSFMNQEEAQKALDDSALNWKIDISDAANTETVTAEDIDLEFTKTAKEVFIHQNTVSWVLSLFGNKSQEEQSTKWLTDALSNKVKTLSCVASPDRTESSNAAIVYSETNKTFEISPEKIGNRVNPEILITAIAEATKNSSPENITLNETFFLTPAYTADSQETKQAKDTLNKWISSTIVYEINKTPEAAKVGKTEIVTWIGADENMTPFINDEAVASYLSGLGKTWDTVGKTREFKTPEGRVAQVTGGTYGWEIDEATELEALKKDIQSGQTITRKISYAQEAAESVGNEWGGTYIDLDISKQHMWYIKDGSIIFEADVVTGLPIPEKETTQGVWTILEKERNKTLIGELTSEGVPEYETPVAYWMRITWTGIGFHDATWQSSFGGDRYLSVGSHGCINMSLGKAATLYDMVETGLPVIVHG